MFTFLAKAASVTNGRTHLAFILVEAVPGALRIALRVSLVATALGLQFASCRANMISGYGGVNSWCCTCLTDRRDGHTLPALGVSLEASVAHTSRLWRFKQTLWSGIVQGSNAWFAVHIPILVEATLLS